MFFDIITINYNNAIGLNKTLKSVFEQTFQNFRVIVVDGNSTDTSLEVVKRYNENKIYLISETDNGIYDAMNKGLKYTEANYFFYLNSGDVFSDKNILEIMHNTLRGDRYDVAYGGVKFHNEDHEVIREWYPGKFSLYKILLGWMPPHPGFTVNKRNAALASLRFDETLKIAGDYGFQLDCLKNTKFNRIVNYDRVLISMEAGGVSNKNIKSVYKSNLEVLSVWRKHLPILPIWIFILKPLSKIIQLKKVFK